MHNNNWLEYSGKDIPEKVWTAIIELAEVVRNFLLTFIAQDVRTHERSHVNVITNIR